MTWFDASLTDDQREVVDLVGSVLPALPPLAGDDGDDPAAVQTARRLLAESGIWSIGMSEEIGGGGAPFDLRQAAFVALGGAAPALTWASGQAHAATEVLARLADAATICEEVVDGTQAVCVIEIDDPHVRLEVDQNGLRGVVGRLDPAGTDPAVVVLDGEDTAWVLAPGALGRSTLVRRTGLPGAMTISAAVDAAGDLLYRVEGVNLARVRASVYAAGAAVAAGIAVVAAERALEYSHQRLQFGAALSALPTVRASIVEQVSSSAESVTAALATSPDSVEHAAAALRGNCERALAVTAAAIQTHGGYGYLDDYGVERLARDAASVRAATGASGVEHRVRQGLLDAGAARSRGGLR